MHSPLSFQQPRLVDRHFPAPRALPPGSLTHEQLRSLQRLALATGDAKLHREAHRAMGAVIGGHRCPLAMAYCVEVQASIEAGQS